MDPETTPPVEAEATPTPAPDEPAAPLADADATPPADAGAGTAETPAKTRAQLIREMLDAVDPAELEEVTTHPRMAGKIGSKAEQLAKKREEDARRAADEAEELEAARQGDLVKLGEKKLKELEPRLQAQDEAPVRQRVFGQVQQVFEEFATEVLPEPVRKELAGKSYEGDYFTGSKTYLKDAFKRAVEVEVENRKSAWQQEALGAARDGEPSPDLGGGTAQAGRQYGSWVEISQAFMDGQVSIDRLREYRAKFGER